MATTRRNFVRQMALAAAVPSIIRDHSSVEQILLPYPDKPQVQYSSNDKIRTAVIGIGIMGFRHCETLQRVPGTELVAVCDLYEGRLTRAKEVYGNHLFTTRNYKEILGRKDIDAVFVATSDHWHDHIAIEALQAGKHVYLEKPMVHHIEEGHALIAAEKKSGKVLQVGSQFVSNILFKKAQELYRRGDIGQLVMVDIFYDRFAALGAWQYSIPTDASPATVDWDNFIGDAPKRAFDATRFFRWRNYQDYGTGVAGDLYVHLFSGLHLITSSQGPERIMTTGGLRYWKDGRDVPDITIGLFDYPETPNHPAFNMHMRVNFTDGGGGGSQVKLVGTEGSMIIYGESSISVNRRKLPKAPGYGGWDSFGTFPESVQKEFEAQYKAKYPMRAEVEEPAEVVYKSPANFNSHYEHIFNFYDAIRRNEHPMEDASYGLRACGPALASNMSYFEQRIVKWDPVGMKIIG